VGVNALYLTYQNNGDTEMILYPTTSAYMIKARSIAEARIIARQFKLKLVEA